MGETACRVLRVFGRTPVKVYLTSHTRMTSSTNLGNFLRQRRRQNRYNINLRSTLQSNNVLKSDFPWWYILLLLVAVNKPLDLRRAIALGHEVVNSYDFFETPSDKSPTAARRYLIGGRVRHDACVLFVKKVDDTYVPSSMLQVFGLGVRIYLRNRCPDQSGSNLRNRCPDRVQNSRRTIILDDDKLRA